MTPPASWGVVASAARTSTPAIDLLTGVRLRLEAIDVAGAAGSDARGWLNRANSQTSRLIHPSATNWAKVASTTTPNGAKCITWENSGTQSAMDFGPVMFSGHDVAWIFASTSYSDESYNVSNLLDGNIATQHLANSQTTNYDVKLKSAKVVTGYTIATNNSTRAPKAWTFQGSNDYSSWTTLDTQSAQTFPTSADRTFSFSNTNAYLYYRLAVTATVGGEVYITISTLRFTGANLACTTGVSAATMYAVVKAAPTNITGTHIQMNGPPPHYYTNWGGGTIYESWGSQGGTWLLSAVTPVIDPRNWRVIRITTNGTTWQMKLDASIQATLSSKPVGFQPMARIGGSFIGYNPFITGCAAAYLVLDHEVDSTEDATIRSWYASTYGV